MCTSQETLALLPTCNGGKYCEIFPKFTQKYMYKILDSPLVTDFIAPNVINVCILTTCKKY